MLQEIINQLPISTTQKLIYTRLSNIFQDNLPHSLYLDPYQLSDKYGATPGEWKDFMKIPEVQRFIESEIATISEVAARHALKKLQSGDASTQDISAAKQLLESSRLLKQKTENKQQFIISHLPEKEWYRA